MWVVIEEYVVPGGPLNLNSTNIPRPWSPRESPPPFRENSHGRAGNRTRDLMISSQRLWPLDHEAGRNLNCKINKNISLLRNLQTSRLTSWPIRPWILTDDFNPNISFTYDVLTYYSFSETFISQYGIPQVMRLEWYNVSCTGLWVSSLYAPDELSYDPRRCSAVPIKYSCVDWSFIVFLTLSALHSFWLPL